MTTKAQTAKKPAAKSKRRSKRRPRGAKRKRAPRNRKRGQGAPSGAPPKRWLRWAKALGLVVLGVALGTAATAFFGLRWFADRQPEGEGSVAVSWPPDLTNAEAAGLLFDLELTDSPTAMKALLLALEARECIVPGPHLLPRGVSPQELVQLLCRDEERPAVKVIIPEGFNRFAIAKRMEKLGVVAEGAFLEASADNEALFALGVPPAADPVADTAEGFLFPATYIFAIDSEPAAVVARLVVEAERRWQRLIERYPEGWERLQAELGFDHRMAITLASMVEKEAAVAEERPLIASVFLNRLRDPEFRRLQSDPTAVYGCYAMPDSIPACAEFSGKASGAINRDPANRFSTYVVDDLPPGPIANPGDASIAAVLNPDNTEFRYFVAKGGGRHHFSADYDEHKQAIERYHR